MIGFGVVIILAVLKPYHAFTIKSYDCGDDKTCTNCPFVEAFEYPETCQPIAPLQQEHVIRKCEDNGSRVTYFSDAQCKHEISTSFLPNNKCTQAVPGHCKKTYSVCDHSVLPGSAAQTSEVSSAISEASASAAKEQFPQRATLKLHWRNCWPLGEPNVWRVNSLFPTAVVIGQRTTVTGSGQVDEQVSGGSLAIVAMFGNSIGHYDVDVCASKTFVLPLQLGAITWHGVRCPVATGAVSIRLDLQLSDPGLFTTGSIAIRNKGTDNLICLDIDLSKQGPVIVV